MFHHCSKRRNPWLRETDVHLKWHSRSMNYLKRTKVLLSSQTVPRFEFEADNAFPDIHSKEAALKISSSVVALLSYTGDLMLTQCSGVIIEKDDYNGYVVLTSANLIRRNSRQQDMMEDVLAESLKVIIRPCDPCDEESYQGYQGELCAFNFHYNLAWIKFRSHSSHVTAKLRDLDDFINVNPKEKSSFHFSQQSNNIVPGDSIIAVGRYFTPPYDLMSSPGEFILARCNLDCKELFMGTCNITKCGEGGVIINIYGEVIGIAIYYEDGFPTPFLPINIALRCWENYKTHGEHRQLYLGFEATNLYAASIYIIEKIIQKIPSICNGVVIEKVIQGSSADLVGLRSNDVIVRCGGKTVHSFLELLDIFSEMKVGDEFSMSVVRVAENDLIHVNMVVNEVAVENFYRWPQSVKQMKSFKMKNR